MGLVSDISHRILLHGTSRMWGESTAFLLAVSLTAGCGGRPAALLADPCAALEAVFATLPPHPLGRAILAASGVADIVRASGSSHRMVQRWFARVLGIAPRNYLRLARR